MSTKPQYHGGPPPPPAVPPHLAAATATTAPHQPPSLTAAHPHQPPSFTAAGAVSEGGRSPLPPPRQAKPTHIYRQGQVELELEEHHHESTRPGYGGEGGARNVTFTPVYKQGEYGKEYPEGYDTENDATPDNAHGDDDSSLDSSSNLSSISQAPSVERLNISFDYKKTFREHQGARVFKSYKQVLRSVYDSTLQWTYNTLVFTVGLILVLLWGIINALTAFLQAWFLSPLMRVSLVIVRGVFPLVLEPCSLCIKALVAAYGGGGFGGGISAATGGGGTGLGFLPALSKFAKGTSKE